MKRIKAFVQGTKILNELLHIKENKINRAIDSAIDTLTENASKFEEEKLLLAKGICDAADSPEQLRDAVNRWVQARNDSEEWKKRKAFVEELKVFLAEDVEIKEDTTE